MEMEFAVVHAVLPYAVMTLKFVTNAVLMAILRSTLDPVYGVKPIVLTVYQQLVSAFVLCSLAFLFARNRRRPNFQILSWAFLIGLLQIAIAEVLLTSSLRHITATVQSVGLNTIPVVVFVLAVATGRERFRFRDWYGQAKLWGVLISASGATAVILSSSSESYSNVGGEISTVDSNGFLIGVLMVGVAVCALAAAYLLVENVAIQFSSDFTLSAMINVFGTIQTGIIAVCTNRNLLAWKINTNSPELLAILFGGIIVSGIFYMGQNWCIHIKGPVFGSAFSPLLVVFSFLIEILILGGKTHLASIVGAVLVIGGLYLLLWAKNRDYKEKISQLEQSISDQAQESSCTQPLLLPQ